MHMIGIVESLYTYYVAYIGSVMCKMKKKNQIVCSLHFCKHRLTINCRKIKKMAYSKLFKTQLNPLNSTTSITA